MSLMQIPGWLWQSAGSSLHHSCPFYCRNPYFHLTVLFLLPSSLCNTERLKRTQVYFHKWSFFFLNINGWKTIKLVYTVHLSLGSSWEKKKKYSPGLWFSHVFLWPMHSVQTEEHCWQNTEAKWMNPPPNKSIFQNAQWKRGIHSAWNSEHTGKDNEISTFLPDNLADLKILQNQNHRINYYYTVSVLLVQILYF